MNAIVDKLNELVPSTLKAVVKGWKEEPKQYPMAFVVPDEATVTPSTLRKSTHLPTWHIWLVIKATDFDQDLEQIMNLIATVVDKINEDKSLNNTCESAEVTRYTPYTRERELERFWGVITLETRIEV